MLGSRPMLIGSKYKWSSFARLKLSFKMFEPKVHNFSTIEIGWKLCGFVIWCD
jgi:hypothetical protein